MSKSEAIQKLNVMIEAAQDFAVENGFDMVALCRGDPNETGWDVYCTCSIKSMQEGIVVLKAKMIEEALR